MSKSTPWFRVFLLFLVGATAAFLVGKAPVALPMLRAELKLSLFQAGLLISIFSLVAAAFGAVFGAVADRYGQRRVAASGLIIAAAASAAGAFAPNATFLLASRICEGLGFFLVSTAIPPLMLRLSAPEDRQKAMGLWGAFLPAGAATILLAGGLLADAIGWRGLWLLTSGALLVAATWLITAARSFELAPQIQSTNSLTSTYSILLHPGPLLMAFIFAGYSAQFLAVTAFIPLILVEEAGWSVAAAGIAGGMVLGSNITGNLASGIMLDRGISRQAVVLIAVAAMGIGAIGLLATYLPMGWRLASAVLFSALGGLIPGAMFAGAPVHAPHPSRISTVNGLLLQGVALGQLIGPSTAALFAGTASGWTGVLYFSLPVAALTGVLALLLGRLERRS
jgi:MFS family permease